MRHLRIAGFALAVMASSLAPVEAERVRPTVAGELKSASNGVVVIRTEQGTVWTARLEPNAQVKWMGSNRTLSAIPKGSKVMLRVAGSMTDKPLKVDLVADWGSSSQYVYNNAPAPYYTKEGEFAGPGGVGGRPSNAPTPGKDKKVGAYAIHGGLPHENPQEIPNILAPKDQNPGVARLPKGTPGFQMGPVPPAPQATPYREPAPNPSQNYPEPVETRPIEAGLQPNMTPPMNPYMQPGMMQPGMMQPGMMQPGMMQPGMMQPGMMQPGMMQPGMMPPGMQSNMSLDSILNSGDGEDGQQMQQGGPMFPGMQPGMVGMGTPVQMQATVLRADPMNRTLVVQAMGTQMPQHVTVSPQVMMPQLREGQMVVISGSSNPQGIIEAQQVTPYGQ